MDELLDIVDAKGKSTGKTALKSVAHKNGWYHNTIHLWLYTEKNEILLQQRSHKKVIYPLLWDVSVAGHIDAGETFTEATIRETEEEIGLKLKENDLTKIGTHLHKSIYDNGKIKDFEFHQIYIAKLNIELEDLTPQKDEVEALKLVTFNQFENLLANSTTNSHFIASNTAYYKFVLESIKNLKH
ncbi:MAG: NUDIX domain-containing protein [Winogradskyella sp.]|nr:MAG: NUDIX domain-containing protein [Winogradskyella sp.]